MTKNETYAKMIDVLFAGAVSAEPDDINDEVIRIVDTVFLEITKCHNRIKPIAVIFDGIGELYEGAIPDELKVLVGSKTWQAYLAGKTPSIPSGEALADGVKNWLLGQVLVIIFGEEDAKKVVNYAEVAKTFYESWIKYSQKDRRMMLCINKARVNWRTPLQLALMGL